EVTATVGDPTSGDDQEEHDESSLTIEAPKEPPTMPSSIDLVLYVDHRCHRGQQPATVEQREAIGFVNRYYDPLGLFFESLVLARFRAREIGNNDTPRERRQAFPAYTRLFDYVSLFPVDQAARQTIVQKELILTD
ncbi:hypothetical protein FOL46_004656, partial [Perkinsus olseni]